MFPLAFKCHTSGYKSIDREHRSSNLREIKGMVAQDIHKHTKQQHKACQTQHRLLTRGLDHIISSRVDGVPRLKMVEQYTPAEFVLCPQMYKMAEPCQTIQHCSSLSTVHLPSQVPPHAPQQQQETHPSYPVLPTCHVGRQQGKDNSSADKVTMQRKTTSWGQAGLEQDSSQLKHSSMVRKIHTSVGCVCG